MTAFERFGVTKAQQPTPKHQLLTRRLPLASEQVTAFERLGDAKAQLSLTQTSKAALEKQLAAAHAQVTSEV